MSRLSCKSNTTYRQSAPRAIATLKMSTKARDSSSKQRHHCQRNRGSRHFSENGRALTKRRNKDKPLYRYTHTCYNHLGNRAAVRDTGKSWCRSPRHPLQGVDKPQHRSPEMSRENTLQKGIDDICLPHKGSRATPAWTRYASVRTQTNTSPFADEASPASSGQGAIM